MYLFIFCEQDKIRPYFDVDYYVEEPNEEIEKEIFDFIVDILQTEFENEIIYATNHRIAFNKLIQKERVKYSFHFFVLDTWTYTNELHNLVKYLNEKYKTKYEKLFNPQCMGSIQLLRFANQKKIRMIANFLLCLLKISKIIFYMLIQILLVNGSVRII